LFTRTVSAIVLALLLTGMLVRIFNIQPIKTEPAAILVRDDHPTILKAIDDANDWPMFHHDPRHTGYTKSCLFPPLHLKWNYTFTEFMGYSSPAVYGEYLYFGAYNQFYALNVSNGDVLWNFTANDWILGAPAVSNGIVYFGSDKLYALDAVNGELVWNYSNNYRHCCSPTVAYNNVYSTMADEVIALNANTGEFIWSFPANITEGPFYKSSPAVNDGLVYVGCGDHKIYALNAYNGSLVWSSVTSGPVDSSPVIGYGVIYVGANVGSGINPPGMFFAFDASDGTHLWNYTFEHGVYENSPAIGDGIVYIGNPDGYLYALNASNGHLTWRTCVGDIYSSPAITNNVVYVGTNNNRFYGVNATDGEIIWEYATNGIIRNSPAISRSMLFFACADGNMYAFESKAPSIIAVIDIDPDSLNLKSKGKWVTAYIELPEGCDVADINATTILLNDTIPIELHPIIIGDYDENGAPDLMVKIRRHEVIDIIRRNYQVTCRFGTATLTITGYLNDGTSFQGSDTIRIIMPIPKGMERHIFPR
jgi:outer membrane protein assembly factor BamB